MAEETERELGTPHESQPDLRGPAIIIEGGFNGGFKFIGPFETIDAAYEWHKKKSLTGLLGIPVSAVLLRSPEQEPHLCE